MVEEKSSNTGVITFLGNAPYTNMLYKFFTYTSTQILHNINSIKTSFTCYVLVSSSKVILWQRKKTIKLPW